MIHWIRADRVQFKQVDFTDGFNVVLADSSDTSSDKDSRNGLGKSTLIDVIHFLLGSDPDKGSALRQEPLRSWTFEMSVDLRGQEVIVRRNTDALNRIVLEADASMWPVQPQRDVLTGEQFMSRENWTVLLGWAMFGLPVGETGKRKGEKYVPSFRSLIAYFARRRGAFQNPFEQFRRQSDWEKQVNKAYLLGLNWEHARRWQLLRDRENELKELNRAVKTGVAAEVIGSLGALESAKVRLEREIEREASDLAAFRVHPLHQDIQREADRLTFEIRDLTNQSISDQGLLSLYVQSLEEEQAPDDDAVLAVYREAGVVLPDGVVRRLEEVQAFHREVVRNRRTFLEGEIGRLSREIAERQSRIHELSEMRAGHLQTLASHGALEEFNRLQQIHASKVSALEALNDRIALWQSFERGQSAIKIERESLRLDARADLEDRRQTRQEAIALFNANSEALYDTPGELIIDLKDSGLRFDVEIERSRSDGIEQMKVFCFDLMLAQLWSQRSPHPGLLIHDSPIFADVDVRQRARALQLAAQESKRHGFQYICCLNSDNIPYDQFGPEFEFSSFVRLYLTDESEESGLLGLRF